MSLPSFFHLNHDLLLILLAVHCALGTTVFWIVFQHLRHRRRGLMQEARLLALPLPDEASLPHVLVQLPTFNEGPMISRIAEAVKHLDWPRDRLHVQVLDDTCDDSPVHSRRAICALRTAGIDAVLLTRENRDGFKAGALALGMRRSREEYIAILDADYVPSGDFLRACMRPMLNDMHLALVQARCDYLNANENLITYAQRRILDAHFAIEQAARSWSGNVLPFNGTCGVWRRAAIEEAGGWQGDTLAEDLDLSYRVQLLGWRAKFLSTVAVKGELPNSFKSWRKQQFRWSKGFAEVGRKLLPAVWCSHLTLRQKLVSTLHLGSGLLGPLFGMTVASAVIDFSVGYGPTWTQAGLLCLSALEGVLVGPAMLLLTGQRLTRGTAFAAELPRLPVVMALQVWVGLANLGGAIQALFGHDTDFERTPKLATKRVADVEASASYDPETGPQRAAG